jgi:hypothetical protein
MKIVGKIGNNGVSSLNKHANRNIRQKPAPMLCDGIETSYVIGELGMVRVSAMDVDSVDEFVKVSTSLL